MSDTTIKIRNCNNITNGEITITSGKLNILFGRNGTGKSTIAQAISFASNGKALSELVPYSIDTPESSPSVEGISSGHNVAIFNDEYVRQCVYQSDTLIKDAFEVLIRSKEYDGAKQNIDEALSKIKTTITSRETLATLQSQIGVLIDAIKFTSSNKIAKRGGIKGVLGGKGAYFNPPEALSGFKPFFEEEDTVSKWADWRSKGYEQFGNKQRCPYCSAEDTESTKTINKVFSDTFDKASVEYAATISKALEVLKDFIDANSVMALMALFGTKKETSELEAKITILGTEAKYLYDKLVAITSFNGASVEKDNIGKVETQLSEMKFDLTICKTYFVSDQLKTEVDIINTELNNLLEKAGVLKGEIAKYNQYIEKQVNARKKDINDFLSIAGFKYTFDVEINGEGDARALLKFILPDGNSGDVQSPERHLSWGEKHAFSLILFMFDAISKNVDLIILDDPISSFDGNKKYAVINRLFKTGDKQNSLYERTVLMLTHDFEPVIDYVQVKSGLSICATYFENVDGQLKCTPIQKNDDLMSSVVLMKEIALDSNIDIAARIGCLRKFIEHQYRVPREESNAYNIVSSLLHGRTEPTCDNGGMYKLTEEQLAEGNEFIKTFIPDFNYVTLLMQFTTQSLIARYLSESSAYIKMLILRAYTEQDTEARERLRKTNDVLRKYIDETYHIENDYLYSLDVRRFNIVPDNYIIDADSFVSSEEAMSNGGKN